MAMVVVQVELPRERGPQRRMDRGGHVVLGRGGDDVRSDAPDRLVVPGRWLGVTRDAMVSARLLRLAFQDLEHGHAVVAWRTGAQHHPASLRFSTTPPGHDAPDEKGQGLIAVGPAGWTKLYVHRLSSQSKLFVLRFIVAMTLIGAPHDGPTTVGGGTLAGEEHLWLELIDRWWRPRRRDSDERQLTWQRCVSVTSTLADSAPPGRLAEAVTTALRQDGLTELDPDAVRKAWNRALLRLVEVLRDPRLSWMAQALAVPGLADHVTGVAAGRLPSGEPQIRALVAGLRATGRPEWRDVERH